ncbi:MAG: T9SS type A sorting domain-containing protein [Chitinophagaceae bacterium]|nr:T9SS type A sorting domain-containing protein [Chitinophagaceae bacterium]MCW5905045.1 T9SS type A sorting domain-containing protein [Chitinophagaceae bacterium]
MKSLKCTLLLLIMFVGFVANAQFPIAYYDFEDNAARSTTVQTTMETSVSTIGAPVVTTNSLSDAHGAGNATTYGGVIDGMAIGYYGFTSGGRPAAGAALTSPHIKFGPFNTEGLSTITLTMDVMGIGAKMPSNVNVYVSDDDITYTRISTNPTLAGSYQSVTFSLGTTADNKTGIYIIVLGYGAGASPDASDGVLKIDNFTLRATTFAQSMTLANAVVHGTGLASGSSFMPEYTNIIINDAAATVTASSDLTLNGRITLTSGNLAVGNHTLSLFYNGTPVVRNGTSQVGKIVVGANTHLIIGDGTQTAAISMPNEMFEMPTTLGSLAVNKTSGTSSWGNNPITITGNVNTNTGTSYFAVSNASGTMSIGGNLNINDGEFRVSTAVDVSVVGDVLIDGILGLTNANATVTVSGNVIGTGTLTNSSGRIVMVGVGTTLTNNIVYDNVEINSTGNVSLTGSTSFVGFIRLTSGNLVVGSNTLTLLFSGSSIQRNGTSQVGKMVVGSNSHLVIGDGTQTGNITIPNEIFEMPTTLGSLSVNKISGTTNWGDNPVAITGDLNISSPLYLNVNNGSMEVEGDVNFSSATTLRIVAGATVTVHGNVTGTGTETQNTTGRIIMVGSGTTLSSDVTYDNVEINSAGNVSLTGNTTFTGTITLTSGNLVVGNNILTLLTQGNQLQKTAGFLNVAAGTELIFGGGSNVTIANNIFSGSPSIASLTINRANTAARTVSWGINTLTVSGNLTINSGDFNTTFSLNNAAGSLTINGNVIFSSDGVGTSIATTTGTLTVNGDIVVASGTAKQSGTTGRIIMTGNPGVASLAGMEYSHVELNSTNNFALAGSAVFTATSNNTPLRLTNGELSVGANTLTFHTSNIPIVRTAGTIHLSNNSSLAFGQPGNLEGSAFTIPNDVFSAASPEFLNFTVNRTNSLTLNNQNFFLRGVLSLDAGTLILPNNYLFTLRSTSITNTAQVGPIGATGNITYGTDAAFNVERFIPQTGGTGFRAYRDIATGVNPNGGTVFDNWQEGGTSGLDNGVYYGTHVTGQYGANPGGVDATTGYDLTQTGLGSLSTYDVDGSGASIWTTWSTSTSHTTKEALNAFKGYRVLIRGNRLVNLYQAPTPTGMNAPATLRTRGSLVTGDVVYNTTGTTANSVTDNSVKLNFASATGFSIIANPYACIVDWSLVYADASNISSSYYLYDPNVSPSGGVYVTYNSTSDITVPVASAANRYIQPGQAIFVRNTTTSPTVTFRESHKAPNGDFTETFRSANSSQQNTSRIYINLNKNQNTSNYILMDGIAVGFRSDFNDGDGPEDASKISNGFENISIISKSNKQWSIEGRQEAVADDTVTLRMYYGTSGTVGGNYQLSINTEYFEANGLEAYLLDKYTNTLTPLSMGGTSTYNYTVTTNANTYNLRFAIVFKTSGTLPVSFISVNATQADKKINVNWRVAENNISKYEIEKGSNANEFTTVGNVMAKGSNIASTEKYDWIDATPFNGNNYYRIKAIGKDGKNTYSSTVLVRMSDKATSITVYPNPIKDRKLNILSENLAKGDYDVQVYNLSGQLLYSQTLNHAGTSASYSITLPNRITSGIYQLVIKGKDYNNTQSIIVE